MACDSSRIFNFTVWDNTSAPSNYRDTDSYDCEYKIVNDHSIRFNESSTEEVSYKCIDIVTVKLDNNNNKKIIYS